MKIWISKLFLLVILIASISAGVGAQSAYGQTVCNQPGVSCVQVEFTPWQYVSYYSGYYSTGKFFDSPAAAYDALVALTKSVNCTRSITPLSALVPVKNSPNLQTIATFTTVLETVQPDSPLCGTRPPETLTGYVQGIRNVTCPNDYKLTFYETGPVCSITNLNLSLTIKPTASLIPSSSGVERGKVLTSSTLNLSLQQNGKVVSGKQVHLASDRGSAVDAIRPVDFVTTDVNGNAIANISTRNQPGSSTVRSTDASISTSVPGLVTWLPAKYEDDFLVTCYTIANEADAPAAQTTANVCGQSAGTAYRSAFLTDVKMQGSGATLDGSIIHYNARNQCYNSDVCARTATGACAVPGTSIAVDFNVIPRRSTVNVQIIGQRLAQDTGGRITGNHIDEYVGSQPKLCRQLGRRNSGIKLVNY